MRHALRNLIAFVFLCGIFWYVYQDIENLWNPRFQITIAVLVLVFAMFWILVPIAVVKMRIIRRNAKNMREYEAWKSRGAEKPHGERFIFHEKGTLYLEPGKGFDGISQPGRPGEVAFPKEYREWRKIQRVHCYLGREKVLFKGRMLDYSVPLGDISVEKIMPGGVIFEIRENNGDTMRLCFTLSNPLIFSEIFRLGCGQESRE